MLRMGARGTYFVQFGSCAGLRVYCYCCAEDCSPNGDYPDVVRVDIIAGFMRRDET